MNKNFLYTALAGTIASTLVARFYNRTDWGNVIVKGLGGGLLVAGGLSAIQPGKQRWIGIGAAVAGLFLVYGTDLLDMFRGQSTSLPPPGMSREVMDSSMAETPAASLPSTPDEVMASTPNVATAGIHGVYRH